MDNGFIKKEKLVSVMLIENEVAKRMDSLYVVMPAYNEEANIEEVIREWYPVLEGKHEKSRLVVADSGSSDRTHIILKELKGRYPKLEILGGTERQHGPKLIALYKYAIEQEADYVFQTDSDGQTEPAEFEEFWNLRSSYDAIIGKREARGDGKLRMLVEHMVCFLLKIYFNVSVPDANAPFRLMKTDLVQKYLKKLPENYILPNIMMTTYFEHYNEPVIFRTITFKPRQGGHNSINWLKIVQIGWKSLKDFAELRRDMK